jgi:hypothetical protein
VDRAGPLRIIGKMRRALGQDDLIGRQVKGGLRPPCPDPVD